MPPIRHRCRCGAAGRSGIAVAAGSAFLASPARRFSLFELEAVLDEIAAEIAGAVTRESARQLT